MMLKHKFPKPNFKGFMVDNVKANWNMVKIVYGSEDPFVKIVDKEQTCLFHYTQSFVKHTKKKSNLSCKMNTRLFATSTRLLHPLGKLIIVMF
jgi:hypothetical protein